MSESMENYLYRIYCQLSPFYLKSFSPNIHGSIFDFHTNFCLLQDNNNNNNNNNNRSNKKWLIWAIPYQERICFSLLILISFYYATSGYNFIHYGDTFEFLIGDFSLITEVKYGSSLRRTYSLFTTFAFLTVGFTIYQSFNTNESKAYRTYIMYLREFDRNHYVLHRSIRMNKKQLSRSTIILLNYLRRRFDPKITEFKSSFNKFYCLARFFHFIVNCLAHLIKMDKFIYERPLWQIIGRIFGFQITCISIDFLLIFAYCPIMIGYFITMNGIRSINLLRRDFLDSINKIQMISSNCKHKYNQTVKLNILIEKLILHRYMMYVRLNIFSEQIIPYFSPLIILSTIISFVTNQFIWNCLQQIRADQYLLRCLFYYFLILNYSNMLILTYWIAKFNAKLDSLRYVLQATIWHTNPLSNDRFKFHLMFIHERMVSRKPFGMKIGPFSVLTRFIAGDLVLFFSDQTSTIPKILCIMLAFTIASVTFIVYSSMNTNRSLAFLFLNIVAHLVDWQQFYYTHPLWQIILRTITMQLICSLLNFTYTFIQFPLLIGGQFIMLAFNFIKQLRFNIIMWTRRLRLLTNDECNDETIESIKRLQLLPIIERKLITLFNMYVRLIIINEDLQNYASGLILSALFTTFLAIWLYYCLFLDYSVMILFTYFVSKVNTKINSIRFSIQQTINHTNRMATFHFRFYMATTYERMISNKPWGIRIGSITVLTTWVFFRVS
ncbi:uncharacterized protein LOC124494269 [Dermatophagoides farinae]|uniref:uncharacterized protein LOC124494269 n=1 Tax=Dermatophagoides farinae TaxID=6954 RepID=UPI003F5F7F17